MISIIAARAKNGVIGKDGKIPWNIPGEKRFFKTTTMGHVVVMGRKTYQEIGKPLLGRDTVVVSKTKSFNAEGCITVGSLNEAIEYAKEKEIFIAGGAKLYEEALPLAETIYLTEIDMEVEGDVYFPDFDINQYEQSVVGCLNETVNCQFIKYTRKN